MSCFFFIISARRSLDWLGARQVCAHLGSEGEVGLLLLPVLAHALQLLAHGHLGFDQSLFDGAEGCLGMMKVQGNQI